MSGTRADVRPDNVVYCRGERFSIYLDADAIQQRVAELGRRISADYHGRQPILIGVLNGAFIFMADLMRHVDIDCEVDFLKLSSYGASKVSSGEVTELKKIDARIEGRHVIVVEDIVDTGLSMEFMLENMRRQKPASLACITLLHKPDAAKVKLELDYVGFAIPNKFVLGYGLDYGQLGRNLPHIYAIDEKSDD